LVVSREKRASFSGIATADSASVARAGNAGLIIR
jgi:hypothetical protein